MTKKKPLEIDMIAGSQLRDTQGEMLSVEGADISDLTSGKGRINDNHGRGFYNVVGKVTEAKKIFKIEDCENDRHRYYWDKVKAPYVYAKAVLFDDDDHPNARAAAAILRNIHKSDSPLKIKASVEGGVISRGIKDPSLLARTKIHSVALTFTPANNATLVEPISLDKSSYDEAADMELIKSVMHLAETNVPSFRHITRHASASKILNNIDQIKEMSSKLGLGEIDILSNMSREDLIKHAAEAKIVDSVKKINKLVSELNKARPNAVTHSYYQIGDPGAGYTGKDAKNAQKHVVKTMMNKELFPGTHYKRMNNEETGKPELHIAVHRGIGSNFDPDATGKNQFKVTDTHIEQPTHGVHTLYRDVADEYAGDNGHIVSSWIPISKVNALAEYHHGGIKDKRIPIPEEMRTDKWMQSPSSETPGKHRDPGSNWTYDLKVVPEDEARKQMANEPHSASQKHISIKPGKYKRLTDEEIKDLTPKLNKAMMAGYGGAGAPTSMTGGSVIQSESLDDGRKFKFIGCDDCGQEQIYHKHQVKCRHCNKSFPLEKLYGFISPK